MIMRSPTPYVPQRPLTVPTPANNFHLRQPRRRRQGMGDICISGPYGSDANGPLCMDQTTGSPVSCSDPRCGAGSSSSAPPPNQQTYYNPGTPQFSTQPFGSSTTTTFTLDSYLGQWVSQVTAQSAASLANQGMGSVAAILQQLAANAQEYCAVEYPSDCGQMSSIVAKYSAIIQSAFAGLNPTQWNPSTYTAYAPTSAPVQTQSAPSAPVVMTPTTIIPPVQIQATPVTPAPVVNPPAATSNGVNQTTVGSGAGQSNTFNPTSILPDVSSVPDWVWYAGGGLLALIVVSSLVKR